MENNLLRYCCSRGSRSVFRTAGKALGLGNTASCLPFTGEADFSVIPTSPIPEAITYLGNAYRSILYLTHNFYPQGGRGTEVFLSRLSAAQLSLGKQVRIVTLSTGFSWEYPEKIGGMLMRRYQWNGIEVLAIRYKKPPQGLYYERIDEAEPVQQQFAKWCLEELAPDIVHAVYPQPFASFLRACRESNIPYLITATDFSTICPRGTLMDKNNHLCQGSLRGTRCLGGSERFNQAESMLRGADFFTVPSRFSADRFAREISELQPLIVPHDIEPSFYYRHRSAVRSFAFFGELTWSKGVFLLIKAFKKLEGDVSLKIYGKGPLNFLLKLYVLADKRIQIMGQVPREEIPSCYNSADCVVIPSQTVESYSLVLSEAVASGCMVIASDIGSLPQRVEECNGATFISGDSRDLKRALENAIHYPRFPLKATTCPKSECEIYDEFYRKVVRK